MNENLSIKLYWNDAHTPSQLLVLARDLINDVKLDFIYSIFISNFVTKIEVSN